MKMVTVVGARPQFIKAAALSRVLRKEHEEILVHTGQHFDYGMSQVFFDELELPRPDYNLGISGGSHAQMTARMLIAIEEVLQKEKPDALLVYGDTNSTLAAALAAVKLHIPAIHVEAAARLGSLSNPEEVNRITTDHVSSVLFACVPSAMEFAQKEGLTTNLFLVGDPMYDAFLYYQGKRKVKEITLTDLDGTTHPVPPEYTYLTCHRQENTQDEETLRQILLGTQGLGYPVVYPVHPRNRATALKLKEEKHFNDILFVEPVGYLESNTLVSNCQRVVTDSGGVQREAFFAKKPCITVFDYVAWPETMVGGCNQLAKPLAGDILEKSKHKPVFDEGYKPFGNGDACKKICEVLRDVDLGARMR
ncbi:MAG: UDP-N-acetylglucosamine 2-epimerase (non-hydrolyzing) [Sphaerochaeta sp.]|jgi:UDP-N-acetylglucosamine 2-epimerase (non-hydrolysing)/UDP-GlcNAc3NAcA epimerase|nr:MAG: UDP-N-acetylglucosamine 2-epimerase (non-hydrolyzing) [Sphaerochaeta sp.]